MENPNAADNNTCTGMTCVNKTKKKVTILSLDGGGVRGIIPATILEYIEKELGDNKTISDVFDVIAGTSTGGILALGLSATDENGAPKYSAQDIVEMYQTRGKDIFKKTMWQRVKTGFGLWGATYVSSGFNTVELKLLSLRMTLKRVDRSILKVFMQNAIQNHTIFHYRLSRMQLVQLRRTLLQWM